MNENIVQAGLVFAAFLVFSLLIDRVINNIEKRFDASAYQSFRLISNSQKAVLLFIGIMLALSKLGLMLVLW